MNDMEFATHLRMLGYDVHEEFGFNIEVLFNEGLDYRPINYEKLTSAAVSAGYSFTKRGWMEIGSQLRLIE